MLNGGLKTGSRRGMGLAHSARPWFETPDFARLLTMRAARMAAGAAHQSGPDLRYLVIIQRDRDVLRLHVEVERIIPAVAPDAGRFGASERRRQMAHVLRIDPYHSGLDALREAMRTADIPSPQIGREPVAHVVGEAERLGLIRERHHGEHGAEDFLLRDPHRVARAEIERRVDEVTFLSAAPAADDGRAFLPGRLAIGQNLVDM